MSRLEDQLMAMIFVSLIIAFLFPTMIPVPQVKNPLSDFTSLLGIDVSGTSSGPLSGTVNQANNAQNIQASNAQNIGCGASIIGGALTGGALSAIGIITIPIGLIGGGIIGGLTGCLAIPLTAPNVIQAFGQWISGVSGSLPGGIGDFSKGIIIVLQFIGSLLAFIPDWIIYESALFSADPVIALVLLPVQIYTAIIASIWLAKNGRGVGFF